MCSSHTSSTFRFRTLLALNFICSSLNSINFKSVKKMLRLNLFPSLIAIFLEPILKL